MSAKEAYPVLSVWRIVLLQRGFVTAPCPRLGQLLTTCRAIKTHLAAWFHMHPLRLSVTLSKENTTNLSPHLLQKRDNLSKWWYVHPEPLSSSQPHTAQRTMITARPLF